MLRPLPRRGLGQKKTTMSVDNFLPSWLKSSTVFQKDRHARLARLTRNALPRLRRQGQGMTLVTVFGAQPLEKAGPASKPRRRGPAWPQARKAPPAWELLRLGNGAESHW